MKIGDIFLFCFNLALLMWVFIDLIFFESKMKKIIDDKLDGAKFFFFIFIPYFALFCFLCFLLNRVKL